MNFKQNYILKFIIFFSILIIINNIFLFQVELEADELAESYISNMHLGVVKSMENEMEIVKEYSKMIASYTDIKSSKIFKSLENSRFHKLLIISENQEDVYGVSENQDIYNENKYYYDKAFKGENGFFKAKTNNGVECIVLYTPITKQGTVVAILLALYNVDKILNEINNEILKEEAYIDIFDKDGHVVLTSKKEKHYYNSYDEFLKKSKEFYDMKSDIENKKSGYIKHGNDGNNYSYYGNIRDTDWYIFLTLPKSQIEKYLLGIKRMSILTIVLVNISFLAILILFRYRNKEFTKSLFKVNENLRLSNEKFLIAMTHNKQLILEYNVKDNSFKHFGDGFNEYGIEDGTVINAEMLLELGVIHKDYYGEYISMVNRIKDGIKNTNSVLKMLKRGGEEVWGRLIFTSLFDSKGMVISAIGTIEDISEELDLMNKARIDMLTGIYNRHTMEIMITKALLNRKDDEMNAFIIFDLDEFKIVNDTYGHIAGDELLKNVAKSVNEILNENDIFGRLGGDEFIILMKDVGEYVGLCKKITQIMEVLKNINISEDFDFVVKASIGVAISKDKRDTYMSLYKKADDELYKVKKSGKNNYKIANYKVIAPSHMNPGGREND